MRLDVTYLRHHVDGSESLDKCCIKRVIGRCSSNVQSGICLENLPDQLRFLFLQRTYFTLQAAQLLTHEQTKWSKATDGSIYRRHCNTLPISILYVSYLGCEGFLIRFQIRQIPSLFHKSESVKFADPFSNGFGFDFRFEFQKDTTISRSLHYSTSNNSKIVLRQTVTMADQQKVVHGLSNSALFNDLE